MRLSLAPSSGTSPVSKMTLRVPLEALLFLIVLSAAVSGQGKCRDFSVVLSFLCMQ